MPIKKKWEEVEQVFAERNLRLLSDASCYTNKNAHLSCVDAEGYKYSLTYDCVKDKRTKTFYKINKNNVFSLDNIQHWLDLQGSSTQVVSDKYIDEKHPLTFKCSCGELFTCFWNRMYSINKTTCTKCSIRRRCAQKTNVEEIKKELKSYGYDLIDDNIQNIKNIKIKDKDGNEYQANLFAIRYGHIYQKERKYPSSLEFSVAKYLDELDVLFIPQKTFDNCKNINKLKFDFYLPNYNTVIETHGEQHYKDTHGWFGMSLKEQQKRDNIKKDFCLQNNINYVEIPYWAFKKKKNSALLYKTIINKILE